MKKCENCNIPHSGMYGSGRFCNVICATSFSTKFKRDVINEKVSFKLKRYHIGVERVCENCGGHISSKRRPKTKTCGNSCAAKLRWKNVAYRKNITKHIKDRCDNIEERLRLSTIGRKGGFGEKGHTKKGVYCQSKFERECFQYLEDNNITFTPHKPIPNSSKVSDIYLDYLNTWIELDGIDREKKQKWLADNYKYWLDKLEIYKREGLRFYVITSFDKFVELIISIN